MRANSHRDDRFAFDKVAMIYDDGRPRFSDDLVASIAGIAGLRPRDEVLEVGAGTGQLTGALLAFGLAVTAIEPDPRIRAVLAERFGSTAQLEVEGGSSRTSPPTRPTEPSSPRTASTGSTRQALTTGPPICSVRVGTLAWYGTIQSSAPTSKPI
jgi:hypothetical protein